MTNRIKKLRQEFISGKCQALVISDLLNVEYLTGFKGSYGFVLVTGKEAVLFTDARYYHEIVGRLKGVRVRLVGNSFSNLIYALLRKKRIKSVGFEAGALSYRSWREWKRVWVGIKLIPVTAPVEHIRMIKDRQEIKLIREAVRLVDQVLADTKRQIRPGITEQELVQKLEDKIRKDNQSQFSFPAIVAYGKHAAVPHARAGRSKLSNNRLILIDLGAQKKGYSSDLTRTFWLGRITRKFERIYRIVLTAQKLAIAKIAPGTIVAEIDQAARDYIKKQGYAKYFTHALGHGIGKAVHELPRISRKSKLCLRPGMVFSVEPGIYIPGWGGVRIEDLVLVTNKGAEVLSKSPKTLHEITIR